MARTKLRGIGIGGLRIAVESPAAWEWDWPDPHARFRCPTSDPDVYVGVRVGRASLPLRQSTVYALPRGTLEVGRCGAEWGALIRDDCGVRAARFDARIRSVEVMVTPSAATSLEAHHPLAHPLDELLVLHRAARDGGALVRGRLVVRADGATLVLGADEGRVLLRPRGEEVRAWATPWGRDAAPLSAPPLSARLGAVQAPLAGAAPGARPLDDAAASAALLAEVVAPIHCYELAARAATAVEQVAQRVPVVRIGLPAADPVVSFDWHRREAGLGFAPPPGV